MRTFYVLLSPPFILCLQINTLFIKHTCVSFLCIIHKTKYISKSSQNDYFFKKKFYFCVMEEKKEKIHTLAGIIEMFTLPMLLWSYRVNSLFYIQYYKFNVDESSRICKIKRIYSHKGVMVRFIYWYHMNTIC